MDLYAYVMDNPINCTDWLGLYVLVLVPDGDKILREAAEHRNEGNVEVVKVTDDTRKTSRDVRARVEDAGKQPDGVRIVAHGNARGDILIDGRPQGTPELPGVGQLIREGLEHFAEFMSYIHSG
jgi:hypothetical protein